MGWVLGVEDEARWTDRLRVCVGACLLHQNDTYARLHTHKRTQTLTRISRVNWPRRCGVCVHVHMLGHTDRCRRDTTLCRSHSYANTVSCRHTLPSTRSHPHT